MWHLIEAWLTTQLLRQPAFHHAVGFVHKRIHQLRHGVPPEEMGGTKIDDKKVSLANHFMQELRTQVKDLKPGSKSRR